MDNSYFQFNFIVTEKDNHTKSKNNFIFTQNTIECINTGCPVEKFTTFSDLLQKIEAH